METQGTHLKNKSFTEIVQLLQVGVDLVDDNEALRRINTSQSHVFHYRHTLKRVGGPLNGREFVVETYENPDTAVLEWIRHHGSLNVTVD